MYRGHCPKVYGKLDDTCLKINAKEKAPTMFNVGKVRLFRVVTWMEEREAGAKQLQGRK
jgi:hypothetical protein